MNEEYEMTDKQSKRDELMTRIDEIDRWQNKVDEKLKEEMQERKEALRAELQAL